MDAGILILAAALLLGGKFEVPAFLQKKPQTEQLQRAQAELDKAKAAQAAAEAQLAAVRAAEQARAATQLGYAHQFAYGTREVLASIPADEQTAKVKLASDLSARTVAGLEAYHGALAPELKAEMTGMIAQALSAVQAERDAYKAALAERDAQLRTATTERLQLAQKVTELDATVKVKTAETAAIQATVETKTAEVVKYANDAAAEKRRAGSLDAYAGRLLRGALLIAGIYLFVSFGLPGLIKHLDAGPLKTALRNVSGYLTAPLLFHDAKKKLATTKS
jgi:multidrug efflux pump subunit AcrA (membrane-fusion protein)